MQEKRAFFSCSKVKGQKKNLFPPLGCDNLYTKFYLRCSIY